MAGRSIDRSDAIPTTAFVAPYAPHPCGVATFTYDLATAAFPRQIVALHPPDGPAAYPAEVRHRIRRDVEEDYALVAQNLNESVVDIVALQHEHGQWGGSEGQYVLTLVNDLRLPIVTTLHTVPRKPTPEQHRILRTIVDRSAATIVLSSGAAALLTRAYGVDPAAIEVIPHGVPHLPLVDPDTVKARLGLEGRRVLLSFGLLGPGKGCEAVIEAMPAVVASDPAVLYVILGATHHDLRGTDGEAYRDGLVARVAALGLGEHVRFVDRFMGRVELATWVEAADVVMAPYTDLDRVASGTLSYAMGAGRPVIATPFAYAKERLTKGRGVIAPNGSPEALAAAVLRLLGDRKLRDAIGSRAYADTRDMVWSAIGTSYGRVFSRVMRPPAPPPSSLRRLAPSPR